jgi:hypothetical protein
MSVVHPDFYISKSCMKYFVYIIFFAVFFLAGCLRTEGTINLRGKVVDDFTREKIPYRKVIVQGLSEIQDATTLLEIGQFATDSLGYFSYKLKKVKNIYNYNFCLVGDSDYSYKSHKMTLFELQRDARYLSFSLSRLTNFTIEIFRKSITPACDTLILSWQTNGIPGNTFYSNEINNYNLTKEQDLMWIGGEVRSTIRARAFAEKETKLRWVLFRDGLMKEIVDTIRCKRNLANSVYFTY